ncbi:Cytochrome p450, partial [Thalictrum thalictroides]
MEGFAYLTIFIPIGVLLSLFLALAWLWSKNNSRPSPPGPLGLPIIGTLHLLGDLPHQTMHKLSHKYGPIMKLQIGHVPVVVVSTTEAAELFLKTNDKIILSKPIAQASKYLSYGSKGIISAEYGPYWRNIRKICIVHLLSVSKVDSFRPTRKEELRHLIKYLREAAKEPEVVDIGEKLGLAVEEITYRMIFGDHRKHITESFKFKPCVQESLELAGAFNLADFLPVWIFDPQGMTRRWKIVSKLMDEFLDKIVDEYEQNPTDQAEHHGAFIDILLSLMKSNNSLEDGLDRTEVKATSLEMLAAAMDTSAISVEWVFSELLRHPQ